MTIVDYINKYRLEQSKHLLMESNYNITQIADMLGFTSIHYFSRQFKSHFGISPSEYIKTIDKDLA
jgi:AraC-like DNA-binding protein